MHSIKYVSSDFKKWDTKLNRESSTEESQMAKNNLKKHLKFLVNREMQIKSTVRFHFSLAEWLRLKILVIIHASKDVKQGNIPPLPVGLPTHAATFGINLVIPQKSRNSST